MVSSALVPVPVGFGLAFDPTTHEVAPGTWLGGQPLRVMRVTEAGRAAWDELANGRVVTAAGGLLARRLVDAGLVHPVPAADAAAMTVSVVVPVHERKGELDRCLTGLGDRYRVVVVDDGSTDASGVADVARRHGARLVRLERNCGAATARNAGLAGVDTELVAFLDSDTVPDHDWVAELVAHFADPLVGAVAPRIVPIATDGWAGKFTRARGALDLGDRRAGVRPYSTVSYVPTAALLVRRSALPEGAAFDPDLRVGEDVDLVWRLIASGWRIRYEPSVTVGHVEPASWTALLRRRFRYGTSTAALSMRHPENSAPFVVHPWFTATVAAALAGRPVLAATGLLGSYGATRRMVRRAGLPPRRVLTGTVGGIRQTWLGLGRYATQFAGPLLAVAAVRGPRRLAAASLLLGPAVVGWRSSDRHLDLTRYALGSLADDMAYGAGVITGCLRRRTVKPLIPHTTARRGQS